MLDFRCACGVESDRDWARRSTAGSVVFAAENACGRRSSTGSTVLFNSLEDLRAYEDIKLSAKPRTMLNRTSPTDINIIASWWFSSLNGIEEGRYN